jgi:hypothetical protein
MAPPIVTATIQTAVIGALSNILAQFITAQQTNVCLSVKPPFPYKATASQSLQYLSHLTW